ASVFCLPVAHIETNPAFGRGNKIQHDSRWRAGKLRLRQRQGGPQVESSAEKGAIKLFQLQPLGGRVAGPPQANGIQAAKAVVASSHSGGGQVIGARG